MRPDCQFPLGIMPVLTGIMPVLTGIMPVIQLPVLTGSLASDSDRHSVVRAFFQKSLKRDSMICPASALALPRLPRPADAVGPTAGR